MGITIYKTLSNEGSARIVSISMCFDSDRIVLDQ